MICYKNCRQLARQDFSIVPSYCYVVIPCFRVSGKERLLCSVYPSLRNISPIPHHCLDYLIFTVIMLFLSIVKVRFIVTITGFIQFVNTSILFIYTWVTRVIYPLI